jgi:hypothetical protein
MRRTLAAAILAAATIAGAVNHADAQTPKTFPVVGTGDSILGVALDLAAPAGTILTDAAWINVEYGRQPYVAGMNGQASTASIWPLVLSRSQPGGWIIIQDNGLGTSQTAWRTLIQRIVDDTPNDRCLLFVPPVFHWWFNAQHHYATTGYAEALRDITVEAGRGGQCYYTVPWRTAVLGDMTLVCDADVPPVRGLAMPADVENHLPSRCDGQHPSRRGATWLRRAIETQTGALA